jgi:hypothetical protein
MKEFIKRNSPMFSWLSGLGIPIAIVVTGWLITTSIENAKLDSEYVKIALSILSSKTKTADGKIAPFTAEEKTLREWAVRLLNRKSPEKFSENEQKALLEIQGGEFEKSAMFWLLFINELLKKPPTEQYR